MAMNNVIEYKGYAAKIGYSNEDDTFIGEIIDINGAIAFEGETVAELKSNFEGAVDHYLQFCADNGIEPKKPYSGVFNVRISPKLHHDLAIIAAKESKSVNSCVNEAITAHVYKENLLNERDMQPVSLY